MNTKQADELIQLFSGCELSVASLYETFALKLPSSRKVWITYAKEKRFHAKCIDELRLRMNNEKITILQGQFIAETTKIVTGYIEKKNTHIIKTKTNLKEALIVAIDIEELLLDSAWFNVFELDDSKLEEIRIHLLDDTKNSVKRLRKWQGEIKKYSKRDLRNKHSDSRRQVSLV